MEYIDFNDNSIPIGKRKQAYVKWAVKNGTDINKAKRQANKKFGFDQKPGVFIMVNNFYRMEQASFGGISEIFEVGNIDVRKYKEYKWKEVYDDTEKKLIRKEYQNKGWDVFDVDLIA